MPLYHPRVTIASDVDGLLSLDGQALTVNTIYPLAAGTESISGLWTHTRLLLVDGTVDEIQLRIQGHSTQTSDLLVVENSVGTDLFSVSLSQTKSFHHNPFTNALYDLGTTTGPLGWRNIYLTGSILNTSSAQVYLRRSGADALTGNWSTGNFKILANSSETSGLWNVRTSSATPAIWFDMAGGTATEVMFQASISGYGYRQKMDGTTGNWSLQVANGGAFSNVIDAGLGSIVSIGASPPSAVGSDCLLLTGAINAKGGANFNSAGGSTDPDSRFKVWGNAGAAGTPLLVVVPGTGVGASVFGVGINTLTISGLLNYAAGQVSKDRTGAAGAGYAGTYINTGAGTCLIEFAGPNPYSSLDTEIYGFGWQQDGDINGDQLFFGKNGGAADIGTPIMYFRRGTKFMGVGPWSFAGASPAFQLDVLGTFNASGAGTFASTLVVTGAVTHSSTTALNNTVTIGNGINVVLNTSTGTKFGTATSQKLAFFNSTPIVQVEATIEIGVVLSNLGLRAAGTAYPITTSGAITLGSLTAGRVTFAGTAGLLIDDADLTFATDTLTATKMVGTTSVKVGTAAGFISSDGSTGATGTFDGASGEIVTVKDGIITSIVIP